MCLRPINSDEKQKKGQYYNIYEPDADGHCFAAVYTAGRFPVYDAGNDGSDQQPECYGVSICRV